MTLHARSLFRTLIRIDTGYSASALVWLAPAAEVKLERASETPPDWCDRKDMLWLNNALSRKKQTETAVMSGVANLGSAPALTALNNFNALTWKH